MVPFVLAKFAVRKQPVGKLAVREGPGLGAEFLSLIGVRVSEPLRHTPVLNCWGTNSQGDVIYDCTKEICYQKFACLLCEDFLLSFTC